MGPPRHLQAGAGCSGAVSEVIESARYTTRGGTRVRVRAHTNVTFSAVLCLSVSLI